MRGLRAPELAASRGAGGGESRITELLREIAMAETQQLLAHCTGLSGEQLTFILADWEMGNKHMDSILQTKLNFWSPS